MDNDSLFALKLYYEDEYDDEYEIIRMLKIELINQGMQEDEANIKLKEFYDTFGSEVDIDVFKKIKIRRINNQSINSMLTTMINDMLNPINNTPNNEENNEENNIILNPNITYAHNMFLLNVFTNAMLNNIEDVICTLNEEDKSKLKKYKLENNLEDKCSICLDSMEKDQEIMELPCKHIYHSKCINEYLTKYSYKCPFCKKEAGRPVHQV